jgi:1,4-alpha-glucan branching enzyme
VGHGGHGYDDYFLSNDKQWEMRRTKRHRWNKYMFDSGRRRVLGFLKISRHLHEEEEESGRVIVLR